jgi:hypothetical protein
VNKLLPESCYVVLHIAPGHDREVGRSPLIVQNDGDRFELREDIWIERLNEQLAKNIQQACEPPHYNISGHPWDRHLYAFVRRVPKVEKTNNEGMGDLFTTVAVSRLINPTSTGERYCAKVFHFGLSDSAIQAIQFRGISPDVFLSKNPRDWLSVQDGGALRKLMPWVSQRPMHSRIHRAYWYHEYAMRSYYLDARWTLVVSGLEALVNVEEQNVRQQFRVRVKQIADELQIKVTISELNKAYTLRSKLVHGETFLFGLETMLPKDQQSEIYQKLELVLRKTIRCCLEDEQFSNYFRDDQAVKRRWKVA